MAYQVTGISPLSRDIALVCVFPLINGDMAMVAKEK